MSAPRLSARGRLFVGLLCLLCGLLPVLGGLGIGPLGAGKSPGVPDWVSIVAGGVFIMAGFAIMVENVPVLSELLGLGAAAGLAAVGNWIAFGPGTRACTATISGWWTTSRAAGDIECRIVFGWGALLTDIFIVLMLLALVMKAIGTRPWLLRLKKAAEWTMLLVLAPLLLFLVVLALFGGGREALSGWYAKRFGQIKNDDGHSR